MVLVYSDNKNLTCELLGKAVEISKQQKQKVIVVTIGTPDETNAQNLLSYGADMVYMVDFPGKAPKAEEYCDILQNIVNETKSSILLFGSNKIGKELASRLAGKLDTGCVIDAVDLYIENGKITVKRVVYSGNAICIQQFNSNPCIVTIPPNVFERLKPDASRKGTIEKKTITPKSSSSSIINIAEKKIGNVNVEEAEIIVSCGRGFKDKKDIELAQNLADALKGKTVGCSRPIAADLKWLPEEHWIGLSGHKVKPKLYIAAGISGQIQHIAGMRDSSVVVAINKDADALIFNSADYGVVGDLYTVLPKLTKAIKEKME
jgi:electron transfer flavoprotein alpha subunit